MTHSQHPTEPSNAEIKALLEQHMRSSADARSEQSRGMAELKGQVTAVSAKVLEIDSRVHKVEADNRRLRDSHAELEGGLLREVGALAHNDRLQNERLASIAAETSRQTRTLDEQSRALATVVDDTKKAIAGDLKAMGRRYAGWLGALLLAAPKFWPFVEWLIARVKG